jgi:hypothetical protein
MATAELLKLMTAEDAPRENVGLGLGCYDPPNLIDC